MPRRIQWGLALFVVLGFVAPGASHAGAARATQPGTAASPQLASSATTERSDYAPVVVRQGDDFGDARNDRAGGLKRSLVGTAPARRSASPSSAPVHCVARGEIARSSSVSTVALRAPPAVSV